MFCFFPYVKLHKYCVETLNYFNLISGHDHQRVTQPLSFLDGVLGVMTGKNGPGDVAISISYIIDLVPRLIQIYIDS